MPGERRTLLRLLLAAAGATLVLAAPASGSPSVVYGVQDDAWLRYGPGTLAQRVDRLENLGVHLVRINVLWSEVEPRRGHFDWSGYDPVLAALHAAGIEPLLTLVSTPAWANGGRGTNWAPTSGATFAAFAAATARRYPYVRRFLIWNEPNQRRWLRPTSPAVYVTRLLNPAYAAIHRVRETALVGGGVTAPRAATGGVSPVAWMKGMAAAHARLDAYAVNPYPLSRLDTPTHTSCTHCGYFTMATLPTIRADVTRYFGSKPLWLTEYGYQTSPPDMILGVSQTLQAKYIGEAALKVWKTPGVTVLIQYLLHDEPNVGGWQSGLYTAAGKAKLSAHAFPLPLAEVARTGNQVSLWGQVRPGSGDRSYILQLRTNGIWRTVAAGKTGTSGAFQRTITAPPRSAVRVWSPTLGYPSPTLLLS